MTAFSDYLESSLINTTLRGTTFTGGTVYIALYTSDPEDDDSGTEVSDSGYARQVAHETPASGFDAPSGGATANSAEITFPAVVDGQIVVTHWAIFDAVSGGNMLYHAALTSSKTLDPSDVLSFPIGSLTVTLT